MKNGMTQWMDESTKQRVEEAPSTLDLVLTREPDIIENMEFKNLTGKSDHSLIAFKLSRGNRKQEMRNISIYKGGNRADPSNERPQNLVSPEGPSSMGHTSSEYLLGCIF